MQERRRHCCGIGLVEYLTVVVAAALPLGCSGCGPATQSGATGEDMQEKRILQIFALQKAIGAFCNDPRIGSGSIGFLPSRFDPSGGDAGSKAYILALFPRIDKPVLGPAAQLEGDQCLVFFLGGPDGNGWSTNPRNPLVAGGDRIGPFFGFEPQRLVDFHGNGYKSYLDLWGTPIAYFSSMKWGGTGWMPQGYSADCSKLAVQPYPNAKVAYQIISAGPDKKFGMLGAKWEPGKAATIYPPGSEGHDDIANFSPVPLGSKPQ